MKVKHTFSRKVENYEEKLNILILGKENITLKGKKAKRNKNKIQTEATILVPRVTSTIP